MITVPLSQLLDRGVRLDVSEAIAVTQSVAGGPGAPTVSTVELGSDGRARCIGAGGVPTVEALSALLAALLPESGVPPALRYAIARGLGQVTAPPFASVAAFSDVLARFETADRPTVIRGLLTRARPAPSPAVPLPMLDDRPTSSTPHARPAPTPAPLVMPLEDRPMSRRLRPALVALALLGSGLAGFAGVELYRSRVSVHASTPSASAPTAPVPVASTPSPSAPTASVPAASAPTASAPTRPEPVTPAEQPAPVASTRAQASTTSPSAVPSSAAAPTSGVTRPAATDTNRLPPGAETPAIKAPATASARVVPQPALGTREAPAFSPAFSPTGTALFFQTGGARDRTSAIAVASANGGPSDDLRIMTVIDDGSRNYHAQPSPDGRLVAFDSDRDGERGVYVANQDGSDVHRVSGPGYAALPSWAPDGRTLAVVRAEPGAASVWNLWLQPLNGDSPRRLTSYQYGQTWSASWFPDGRRIAYSHESELTILDIASGKARRFAAPVARHLVRTPAVSPDGTRIVFQVQHAGAWMLNVADGSMECVLADPTAEEFAWAPDGRRFAFHSRRGGEWSVYVLSAPTAP
jgi:hypothetical protein